MRLIEGFTEVAVSIGSSLFAGGVGAGLIRPNTKRFSDIFEGLSTRIYRSVIRELSRRSRSYRGVQEVIDELSNFEDVSRIFEEIFEA